MDEEKKNSRHTRWEELGEDAIRADMENGGHGLVGGSPEVRQEARNWLKEKNEARETKTEKTGTTRFALGSAIGLLAIFVSIVLWYLSN